MRRERPVVVLLRPVAFFFFDLARGVDEAELDAEPDAGDAVRCFFFGVAVVCSSSSSASLSRAFADDCRRLVDADAGDRTRFEGVERFEPEVDEDFFVVARFFLVVLFFFFDEAVSSSSSSSSTSSSSSCSSSFSTAFACPRRVARFLPAGDFVLLLAGDAARFFVVVERFAGDVPLVVVRLVEVV